MKLAPLLAEYLFQNKRLDLPGIGTFRIISSISKTDDSGEQNNLLAATVIGFEVNPSLKESSALIEFISSKTGKMKALAAADLDSHLELAQQFINIGKPFLLEGIGSLIKTKSGRYEFVPEHLSTEKTNEYSSKEISATSSTEESFTQYENIFSPKKVKMNWGKPFIFASILIGIGLAVWGGYMISQKRAAKKNTALAPEKKEMPVSQPDTIMIAGKTDSLPADKPVAPATDHYKFVVEVAKKERGLYRYKMLKGFDIDVQMETKDSVEYKLFFLLPASAKDTARLMDSLRNQYTPYWSRSFVEN